MLGGSAWPLNNPQTYRGLVTVADALRVSSNPAAVRVLQMLGFENSFNFMQDNFHIDLEEGLEVNGEIKNDLGSSQLALGGLTNGVRVIDMATAYSVFPRDGLYIESRTYTQVTRIAEDGTEEVILDNTSREPEAVLSSETTYYINDMLKDVVTGGNGATGTAAQISGMTVAGKTGSTNSNTDRWFVGYTPYYTAAVWVGYSMPERIYASGNPAVTMWEKVMSQVHEGLENKDFTQPDGLVTVQICRDSGLRASEACLNDPRGQPGAEHDPVRRRRAGGDLRHARVGGGLHRQPGAGQQRHRHRGSVPPGRGVLPPGGGREPWHHRGHRPDHRHPGLHPGAGGRCELPRRQLLQELPGRPGHLRRPHHRSGACGAGGLRSQQLRHHGSLHLAAGERPRYENFDPENPATWPTPEPEETPGAEIPDTGETTTPDTTPAPSPTSAETPGSEPFIPASQ